MGDRGEEDEVDGMFVSWSEVFAPPFIRLRLRLSACVCWTHVTRRNDQLHGGLSLRYYGTGRLSVGTVRHSESIRQEGGREMGLLFLISGRLRMASFIRVWCECVLPSPERSSESAPYCAACLLVCEMSIVN